MTDNTPRGKISHPIQWGRNVNLTLAFILVFAAIFKADQLIADPDRAIQHDSSKTLLVVLMEAECLLAAWLVMGSFERARHLVTSGCFCIFAAVASFEALHAMPTCGCFGNVKVPPLVTACFDVSAVIALWLTRPRKGDPPEPPPSRRRLIGVGSFVALASIALWTGYFLKASRVVAAPTTAPAGGLVVLEPSTWINKPFALLDEIEGENASALRTGGWLVVLYHSDCDSCRSAIPLYSALAEQMSGDASKPRVAFIAMPPVAPAMDDPVKPSAAYLHLTLRPDHDWFATTPVVAALEEGRVVFAADGEDAVHPPGRVGW